MSYRVSVTVLAPDVHPALDDRRGVITCLAREEITWRRRGRCGGREHLEHGLVDGGQTSFLCPRTVRWGTVQHELLPTVGIMIGALTRRVLRAKANAASGIS